MSLIDRNLLISAQVPDSVDIHPTGTGCEGWVGQAHDMLVVAKVYDFKYEICGRCGTVRISERRGL